MTEGRTPIPLTYLAAPYPCLRPVRRHETYSVRCGECENCKKASA